MFTVGMGDLSRIYFSVATAIIGIPTAIKILLWTLGLEVLMVFRLPLKFSHGHWDWKFYRSIFGRFIGRLGVSRHIFCGCTFPFCFVITAAIRAFCAIHFYCAVNSTQPASKVAVVLVILGKQYNNFLVLESTCIL
jgi:hypothetical protein